MYFCHNEKVNYSYGFEKRNCIKKCGGGDSGCDIQATPYNYITYINSRSHIHTRTLTHYELFKLCCDCDGSGDDDSGAPEWCKCIPDRLCSPMLAIEFIDAIEPI